MENTFTRVLRIKDMDVEAKTVLSDEEATHLVCLMIGGFIDNARFNRPPLETDWIIRMATIMTYTNFDPKSVPKCSEIIYDAPLYAMLVGCPERPIYFEGEAYTEPAVDTKQFYTILSSVNTAMLEIIEHFEVKEPNSSNE